MGSYAREEQDGFSDVDIMIFYANKEPWRDQEDSLEYRDGLLVSISHRLMEHKRATLKHPLWAIHSVAAFREMHILTDVTGRMKELKEAADAFCWGNLHELCNRELSTILREESELIPKMDRALSMDPTPVDIVVPINEICGEMSKVLCVHFEIHPRSSNRELYDILSALGYDSVLGRAMVDALIAPDLRVRIKAAKKLFQVSFEMVKGRIDDRTRGAIEQILSRTSNGD